MIRPQTPPPPPQDTQLPLVEAEIEKLLRRVYGFYTHVGGSLDAVPIGPDLFALFAQGASPQPRAHSNGGR